MLYPRVFMSLYGASGEQISDEEALAFAEEYNFVTAKHILFRTTDDSGNDLSDAEKEKNAPRLRPRSMSSTPCRKRNAPRFLTP